MRTIRRCALVASLLIAVPVLGSQSDDGSFRQDIRKDKHRSFVQRILDLLDSKLSTPPG